MDNNIELITKVLGFISLGKYNNKFDNNNNNEELIVVNDYHFHKYFNFTPSKEYIETILEFVEQEHISTIPDDFDIVFNDLDDPILLDLENNKLFKISKNIDSDNYEYTNKGNSNGSNNTASNISNNKHILELYKILTDGFSIYTPTFIATNSIYAKHVLIILFNKFQDICGYNYILFRFLEWVSAIVIYYLEFKEDECPIGSILSLPFNVQFISNFFIKASTNTSKYLHYSYHSQLTNIVIHHLKPCQR
ncbi:KN57gp_070 [Dikerogammarus haemobaphes nudivirus]|nr:KN57gp_070 [Dikerogammarus haemobaphes nudivirus]